MVYGPTVHGAQGFRRLRRFYHPVRHALDRFRLGSKDRASPLRLRARVPPRRSEPHRDTVVLDHCQVVERGRHEELLAAGGRYATLVSRDAELEPPALV